MITGELKNKIDRLWETFWTGGITNPLDVVEQMTYLMFIHDLDATDNQRAKESAMLGLPHKSIFADEVRVGDRTIPGNQLKWSVFHDLPAGQMYSALQEWVFPFIKDLHADKDSAYAKYMGDAIFKIPTPLMLDKIVTAMDEIYAQAEQLHDVDVRGDIYEYLLSKIATAGVEWPVPHPPAHHPHDGGHDGPSGGRRDLRPGLRHRWLPGGGGGVPQREPQRGNLL